MTLFQGASTQLARQRLTAIACSTLLAAWLLSPTVAAAWINRDSGGWQQGGLTVLFALAVLAAPLTVLARPRRVFWFWLPAGMLAPLQIFLIDFFGSVPGDALTQSMLRTSARELSGLLGGFGWLPYTLPLFWLAYWLLLRGVDKRFALAIPQRKGLLALLLLYVLAGVLRDASQGEASAVPTVLEPAMAEMSFPTGTVVSLARVLYNDIQQTRRVTVRLNASAPTAPQLLIFVIGETLRPDHLGVNGYARDTTPELGKLGDELLSFSNVASTANYTIAAMGNLVMEHRRSGSVSVIDAFREAGFTTAWLSNQDRSVQTPDAHVEFFSDTDWEAGVRYDSVLLPHLRACLKQCGERQFIVLHMLGSHFPYDTRYPASRAVFTPVYGGMVKKHLTPASKQALINSYDNSVVETDRFLSQVITQANSSGKPALVVFTADHGENLYDDERQYVLHGGDKPSRADTFVPLLVWANAAYRQAHPDKMAALRAHRDAPVSHPDLVPLLLDMAQVSYDGKLAQRSLASPLFAPAKRFVHKVPVDTLR